MISYPTTLPCPTTKAKMKGGETFLRVKFAFSTRQRPLPTSDYALSALFVCVSDDQMTEFRKFYHDSLISGVRSFEADWLIEGSRTIKEFRFSKIYTVIPRGAGLYEIAAEFDMLTNIKDI